MSTTVLTILKTVEEAEVEDMFKSLTVLAIMALLNVAKFTSVLKVPYCVIYVDVPSCITLISVDW